MDRELPSIPQGVYLETSVLGKPPVDLQTASFLRLRELSDLFRAPILLPAISLKELVLRHHEWLESCLEAATQVSPLAALREMAWPQPGCRFDKEVQPWLEGLLDAAGITLVDMPQIPLSRAVDLSFLARPFLRADIGVRDAAILLTVLSHAQGEVRTRPGSRILVAADKRYDEELIRALTSETGLNFVLARSIQEAVTSMEKWLDTAVKSLREQRLSDLHQFLEDRRDQIELHIRRNATFGERYLSKKAPFFFGDITGVSNLRLLGTKTPVLGPLPERQAEGRAKVFFYVTLEITVTIQPHLPPPFPAFRCRADETSGAAQWERVYELPGPALPAASQQKEFELELGLEGSVAISYEKRRTVFSDLRIDDHLKLLL